MIAGDAASAPVPFRFTVAGTFQAAASNAVS
jgi:hypothetical protein